jgi:hypothetical protein
MADQNKKSTNFLPEFLRTEKNSKFLASTIDQFNQTPQIERIDGFVGSKITPSFDPQRDFYLNDSFPLRKNYQLEPALVFRNNESKITDVVSFDDLINEIGIRYKNNQNLDKLFRSKIYSYDPLIDWDKLINYDQYYWLPEGAALIVINSPGIDVERDIVGQSTYLMPSGYYFSNGMKVSFGDQVEPESYRRKEFIVEGVGSAIKLIDFSLLDSFDPPAREFDEVFDGTDFDDLPFDGDRRLPLDPEYITINRSSRDLNPWSRYNRWFHRDIISVSAEINNLVPKFPLTARAKRPIVEFRPNLQLYNFGKLGIRNVDLIDDNTDDIFTKVDGSFGYYVDGVLLQTGQRVIFNSARDTDVRGKIYQVRYETVNGSRILRLDPAEDFNPADLNSTSVNYGNDYTGSSWHYSSSEKRWSLSQQRSVLNQAPLFDLFDNQGTSYREININDFRGNKIFGYNTGTGVADSVLGFPLNYQSRIGIGSFLFKNYFMTENISITVDNTTSLLPTSITFIKQYDDLGNEELVNVWRPIEEFSIPILELRVVDSPTDKLYITSLDKPTSSPVDIKVFVNDKRITATQVIEGTKMAVEFDFTLAINDRVLFKIYTDQLPNSNGYYETPISLTNNPLNGPIGDMTLTELSAHFDTMVEGLSDRTNALANRASMRDIPWDYTSYGTRLIINGNPVSFPKIFLGKPEHNVVDAVRLVGEQYNQFKMNFIRLTVDVNETSPVNESVDLILSEINKHRDSETPYFRSDMLGYGEDKIVREFRITDSEITEYPLNFEFDPKKLSFQSVLIYLNDQQLIFEKDYTFDLIDNTVVFVNGLPENSVLKIHCYRDTRGSFVPPTPTKLGLYPKFEPLIYQDDSYIQGSVRLIRCHDGSVIKAYDDYRDDVILELEKRIYNNIKVDYDPVRYDIMSVLPGAFRTADYSLKDFNDLIVKDFIRWAGVYGVDAYSNDIYDPGNSFTWNYRNTQDTLFNQSITGTWRSIYQYFYDTDRPHTHPWEMLGHLDKPLWWDDYYSWTDSDKRTALINSIVEGRTDKPPSDYVNPVYVRSGFASIVPVDESGTLLAPDQFLTTPNSYYDKIANWKFGDIAPAEYSWRRSSYWPFVINSAMALLDPCCYITKLYDVSRTGFNSLGQLVYLGDDLYLNPKKLIIEGENDQQISGFGNYIVENGRQRIKNYIEQFRQDLDYLDFNLFHKLGGYASKEKLQITIDSIDPSSTSPGVLLPPEDFNLILNVSNPVKTISISGIIVQKSQGKFIVKGYDKTNPYFEIYRPIKLASSGALTVGGVSAPFIEWKPSTSIVTGNFSNSDLTTAQSAITKFYKLGQIVFYNGRYYRVKTGHNAQPTFDPDLFQLLPELPVTGGATVELPANFETLSTQIAYGSEFTTLQEVYDIIVGYGEWLTKQGFIFDSYNSDLKEVIDWNFSGKEFLYWTTQNWSENNLITLSPFAEYLKYQFTNSVVDNILSGNYEYSLLKADGRSYPVDKFSLSREDGFCVIKTRDPEEGLFFATLNLVQKEHALVFNNTTIFNDTVYDIETGYKQQRVKLSGFRTKNWNGDLYSPGFVYDSVEVSDWQPYETYLPGKVVRYNGSFYQSDKKVPSEPVFDFNNWIKLAAAPQPDLLPNFDYKINQFEDFYSLDVDNFDFGQQTLAQKLTGYTARNYLNGIFTNPISQYKFYQGFIKEKGTKNAIDKLSKVNSFNQSGNIEINEEWAFRVGNYGSYETYKEIEFSLEEGSYLENPYVVKFVESVPSRANPLVRHIPARDLLISPDNYNPAHTFVVSPGTFAENNIELTTAGYVRLDDVTSTAYNKNSILDIANNSLIKEGDTIWTGFLENGDWTVYRYSKQTAKISGVYVSAPGEEITFVTDKFHNLNPGDIVSVVRFNQQVNGVYLVKSIPKLNQFTVGSELAAIVNEELLSYGLLFKFSPTRFGNFENFSKIPNLDNFAYGEKIWIDSGEAGKWAVYEKKQNYNCITTATTVDSPVGQRLGQAVWASDTTSTVIVSATGWGDIGSPSRGRIRVYTKNNDGSIEREFEYILNSEGKIYCNPESSTQFGFSLAFDESKGLFFAGAPEATGVRGPINAATTFQSPGSGPVRPFINDGVVKISSRNQYQEKTEIVLINPGTSPNRSRFGHSIYINQVAEQTATTVLISAPGERNAVLSGNVYAYKISKNNGQLIVNPHESGLILQPSISLSVGSQWGHKISGNKSGSVIAVSAPGYLDQTNNRFGIVEIFDKNLSWKQTLHNPFAAEGRFGDDISVSGSGKYIFVSSTGTRSSAEPFGKVAVFVSDETGHYLLNQIIDNPLSSTDLRFGFSISISADEKTLAVSSLGTNRSKLARYDTDTRSDNTVFDSSTTRFITTIPDAGSVHVYNNLGDYFIQADSLDNAEILSGSRYGTSIAVTDQDIFIGAPSFASSGISSNPADIIINPPNITVGIYDYLFVEFSDPDVLPGIKPIAEVEFDVIDSNTRVIKGLKIIARGSGYLKPPIVTIKDVCGIITDNIQVQLSSDNSRFYQFRKIDSASNSWQLLRQQTDLVDISTVKRVALIDTFKEEVIDYLDIIDPLKGKISGIAEQEIKYKSAFDPATYTLGVSFTVNDSETNWIDEHVGELWWDLSTAKYVWYEQGDEIFRKNNWGKLFPGATIDVYEWVRSNLLPSEWAIQADTTEGLTRGISGQPKYPDNSVLSVKQTYNNVTGSFENVYYFWVKNKVILPNVKNRRTTAFQVASIIADPVANGLKFAQILSPGSVAFANVQPLLVGNRISANISMDIINNPIPRHTEWMLLQEGKASSVPPPILEKKLFDSLLGHDDLGNLVPDPDLSSRARYGLGIRPQQTLFKDRLSAIRNLVDFSNDILLKNQITGNYNFSNLNREEEIPPTDSGQYDQIVFDLDELAEIETREFRRALLNCEITNGKISRIGILDPGQAYSHPPMVTVVGSTESKIKTEIDDLGRIINVIIENSGSNFVQPPELTVRPHTVIVQSNNEYGNKWTKHEYDYDLQVWDRVKTQSFNTKLYWNYIDWQSENYDIYRDISLVLADIYQLPQIDEIDTGSYVKVSNIGDGRFVILERTATAESGNFLPFFNIVYSERGTIQISDTLWNFSLGRYTYDDATLEETLYDQVPDLEIFYILTALKEDIFIRDLKANWNRFFFTAVKYAMTEQKLIDWAFKTSFINVKNATGTLDQRPVYRLDNDEFFEEYIKEVKPYHSEIREFVSGYTVEDQSELFITDFDLPSRYNNETGRYETVSSNDPLMAQRPWKDWADNYTYSIKDIVVADAGSGYTQQPVVIITTATGDSGTGATAEAFIRNGQVYEILVTNPGSGYVIPPEVSLLGGGIDVDPAKAVALLENLKTRKNTIGLKFDRISTAPEIFSEATEETFVCNGSQNSFDLQWLADPDKNNIVPLLDGKLILAADYSLEIYKNQDSLKTLSRFVFLNLVPAQGQIFKITYRKDVKNYSAVDRITKFYQPSDTMPGNYLPMLMTGMEYPQTIVQGLPFDYSVAWDNNFSAFDKSAWGDLTQNHVTTKIVSTVTVGSELLFLDSVEGIEPGQAINILDTATIKLRTDTVVSAVYPENNSVALSIPRYSVRSLKPLNTATGSTIVVRTRTNFNGDLRPGDRIFLFGVVADEFNGFYEIQKIRSNNSFEILSSSELTTFSPLILPSSEIKVSSVLSQIEPASVRIETIAQRLIISEFYYNVMTNSDIRNVDRAVVRFNGFVLEQGSNYEIVESDEIFGRAVIRLFSLPQNVFFDLSIELYKHPAIEFWTNSTDYTVLDTAISGGSQDAVGNFLGAAGVDPEDLTIDGQGFLTVENSYSPEELVSGHVLDSLGVSVYTRDEQTYALIVSGAFPVVKNSTTTVQLSVPFSGVSGMVVYYNGKIFNRSTSTNFTNANEYFVKDNSLILPPQNASGRGGYTIISTGGGDFVDGAVLEVENQTQAQLESVSSINDIRSAYVLVDGVEIFPVTTSTDYGYMLMPASVESDRAAVRIYNLNPELHFIEAWFFTSEIRNIGKVNEEIFLVDDDLQTTFGLSRPPATLEPASAQAIVDLSYDAPLTQRKRLNPPWVSYYQVKDNQITYRIDNKNVRPSGTYNTNMVKVYINGIALRPGFDYTVDSVNSTVTLSTAVVRNDDVVAVMGIIDYDYVISGNVLELNLPSTGISASPNTRLRVMTFDYQDSMLIRTERFRGNKVGKFVLSRPVINDNYIWVSLRGVPLIARYDFEILDDLRTVQFSEWVNVNTDDDVVITTLDVIIEQEQLIGFRIFKDMFDRQHYKRLSKRDSTVLTRPLEFTDTEIHVSDSKKLANPDASRNIPGVILLDSERIEYFVKDGNILKQLRRSTLGTGPATYSYEQSQVYDQSQRQNIPYRDLTLTQRIISTTTNTYTISTVTNSLQGNGIVFDQTIPAQDQIMVYYGGRLLRKLPLSVQNINNNDEISEFPPEFSVTTATNQLILNMNEPVVEGTMISIVQKKGHVWTGTESLLTSDVIQAKFLRAKESELPGVYYYGGDPIIREDSYIPITEEDDDPLEEGF